MPVLSSRSATTAGSTYLSPISSLNYSTSRYSGGSGSTAASSALSAHRNSLSSPSLSSSSSAHHRPNSRFLGTSGNGTTSSGYSYRTSPQTSKYNGDDSTNANNRFGVSTYSSSRTSVDFGKPPSGGTALSSRFRSDSRTRDLSLDRGYNSGYTSTSSSNKRDTTNVTSSYHNTKRQSPSLASYVATSGADLHDKYSPAHYSPKTELSRSRSLSEATTGSAAAAASGGSTQSLVDKLNNGRSSATSSLYAKDNYRRDSSSPYDSTSTIINKVNQSCVIPQLQSKSIVTKNTTTTTTTTKTFQTNSNNNNLSESVKIAVTNQTTNHNKAAPIANNLCKLRNTSACAASIAPAAITATVANHTLSAAAASVTKPPFGHVTSGSNSGNNSKDNKTIARTKECQSSIGNKNSMLISPNARGNFKSNNNNNIIDEHKAVAASPKSDFLKRTGVNPIIDKNFLKPEYELVRNQLVKTAGKPIDIPTSNTHQSKPLNGYISHRHYHSDDLTNNNMNCLQRHASNGDLLDDIKYIDSDEGERKPSPTSIAPAPPPTKATAKFEYLKGTMDKSTTVGSSTLPTSVTKKTIDTDTNKYNTLTTSTAHKLMAATPTSSGQCHHYNTHHHKHHNGIQIHVSGAGIGNSLNSESPAAKPQLTNGKKIDNGLSLTKDKCKIATDLNGSVSCVCLFARFVFLLTIGT